LVFTLKNARIAAGLLHTHRWNRDLGASRSQLQFDANSGKKRIMDTKKRFFNPIKEMTPDQVRAFMERTPESAYTLLDVRQPNEYQAAHLAGARLVPLPELGGQLETLDRKAPVIVYCASGSRSRAAAQLMAGRGFSEVYNLTGGVYAWEGEIAEGPEELNLEMIRGDETPEEIVSIGCELEQGLGIFYRRAISRTQNPEVADLLGKLAAIEDRHQTALRAMTPHATQAAAGSDRMEGGFDIEGFLETNQAYLDTPANLLELAMMLETQAMDLYLRFAQKSQQPEAREVLYKIAGEEKAHLASLGRLLETIAP
jgi:rhodanese-related sulfurtransferase/rubrerythrin